ncbi:MAG: hypothetical protein IPG17_27200 [Sandaracinaceae bacterium]|nr:hypothetical protein [Sandaracinaceae bacterium]
MSRSLIAALTALTAFTGCSDKGAIDTADTEETAAPAMINLTVELDDIVGGADLSAATATIDGETLTKNADGTFSGTAPQNTLLTARASAPGYMEGVMQGFLQEVDMYLFPPMLDLNTRDGISAALGLPYDETKAMLMIRAYLRDQSGAATALGGVTIDIDAPYDVALTSDQRTAGGLVPSNTTVSDAQSRAQITFINVVAGEIGVTVTAPEDVEYCTWYRAETRVDEWRPTIEAGVLNSLYVICY